MCCVLVTTCITTHLAPVLHCLSTSVTHPALTTSSSSWRRPPTNCTTLITVLKSAGSTAVKTVECRQMTIRATVLSVARCPSLSVCHVKTIKTDGGSCWFLRGSFIRHTAYCNVRKLRQTYLKNNVLPSETLPQTLNLQNFATAR